MRTCLRPRNKTPWDNQGIPCQLNLCMVQFHWSLAYTLASTALVLRRFLCRKTHQGTGRTIYQLSRCTLGSRTFQQHTVRSSCVLPGRRRRSCRLVLGVLDTWNTGGWLRSCTEWFRRSRGCKRQCIWPWICSQCSRNLPDTGSRFAESMACRTGFRMCHVHRAIRTTP